MPGQPVQKTIRSKTGVRELYKRFKQEFQTDLELWFFLQDWEDPYNVGGMFRVADACGAKGMIMTGKTPCPPHPQIHVTSMGHHRRVFFRYFESHLAGVSFAQKKGLSLVAVELAEGAVAYFDYDWPQKVCLILGSETEGIHDGVMAARDAAVYIPQIGKGRSMNVHVSAAVVGFHALFIGGPGQREL